MPKEKDREKAKDNKKKNKIIAEKRNFYIAAAVLILFIIIGSVVLIKRYAPTNETMPLSEYFVLEKEDSAAIILNGNYDEADEEENALIKDGNAYIALSYLKENLDDRYFYDDSENILRYVLDKDVITAYLSEKTYLFNKDAVENNAPVVITEDKTVFISLDFVLNFTDITYKASYDPNRIQIETAGFEKNLSTLKKDESIRRFGGVKSKILKEGLKGDTVLVMENYGKWSRIVTEDGVIGCVRNKRLGESKKEVVEARLAEREYNHLLLDEPVSMLWHQVTQESGNSGIDSILSKNPAVNVISPTWFALSDNEGGLRSFADMDYVNKCHSAGIMVWALYSNFEIEGISINEVLNKTSSRDNLINNILAQAIAYGIDGVNIDFEGLTPTAGDGYIEFIRELSLRLEKNDLYLSVDNYVPTDYTAFYNRSEQALFADYVVIMGYDEFYGGSEVAGPNASLPFVEQGVIDTLKEVPGEQIILAMPFYMRAWTEGADGSLSQKAIGINKIDEFLQGHDANKTWKEDLSLNYSEFYEDGNITRVWIEDEKSLEEKLNLLKKYELSGAAFWKSGFETDSVWNLIRRYVSD